MHCILSQFDNLIKKLFFDFTERINIFGISNIHYAFFRFNTCDPISIDCMCGYIEKCFKGCDMTWALCSDLTAKA